MSFISENISYCRSVLHIDFLLRNSFETTSLDHSDKSEAQKQLRIKTILANEKQHFQVFFDSNWTECFLCCHLFHAHV